MMRESTPAAQPPAWRVHLRLEATLELAADTAEAAEALVLALCLSWRESKPEPSPLPLDAWAWGTIITGATERVR